MARKLRHNPTDAECKLWQRLRKRQVAGGQFRGQYCIGSFIADFCCPRWRLVIELGGSGHAEMAAADQRRSDYLVSLGYRVLRFWDNDALRNTDAVVEAILDALGPESVGESEVRGIICKSPP